MRTSTCEREKEKTTMKTEAISRNSKCTDDPGTAAPPLFTPGSGGENVSQKATVTTNYTVALTESANMVYMEATAQGLLPDAVFVAASGDELQSFWLENSSQAVTAVYRWGSGYYVGLSQKSYSGGDSSYTLLCSAGPT